MALLSSILFVFKWMDVNPWSWKTAVSLQEHCSNGIVGLVYQAETCLNLLLMACMVLNLSLIGSNFFEKHWFKISLYFIVFNQVRKLTKKCHEYPFQPIFYLYFMNKPSYYFLSYRSWSETSPKKWPKHVQHSNLHICIINEKMQNSLD